MEFYVLLALRSLRWGNDAALRACFGPRLIVMARKPEATSAVRTVLLEQIKGDGSKPTMSSFQDVIHLPDVLMFAVKPRLYLKVF